MIARLFRGPLAFVVSFALVMPVQAAQAQARVQDPEPVEAPPPAEPPPADPAPSEWGDPVIEPPPDAPPAEPTGETTPTYDPNDEYQQLLHTLPSDYDINYRFYPTDRGGRRGGGGSPMRSVKPLRIAGTTFSLVGAIAVISTLSAGLAQSKKASDELEENPTDLANRQDLLKKGENGDKIAIIGGATSGAVMVAGIAMLLAAGSIQRRGDGGGGRVRGGGTLSSQTKRSLTIGSMLLGLYGAIGLGVGLPFMLGDNESRHKGGKVLVVTGGIMLGAAVPMWIALGINKARGGSSRITPAPMFVRQGGGAGLRVTFLDAHQTASGPSPSDGVSRCRRRCSCTGSGSRCG